MKSLFIYDKVHPEPKSTMRNQNISFQLLNYTHFGENISKTQQNDEYCIHNASDNSSYGTATIPTLTDLTMNSRI